MRSNSRPYDFEVFVASILSIFFTLSFPIDKTLLCPSSNPNTCILFPPQYPHRDRDGPHTRANDSTAGAGCAELDVVWQSTALLLQLVSSTFCEHSGGHKDLSLLKEALRLNVALGCCFVISSCNKHVVAAGVEPLSSVWDSISSPLYNRYKCLFCCFVGAASQFSVASTSAIVNFLFIRNKLTGMESSLHTAIYYMMWSLIEIRIETYLVT
jgi:hypothetical protein